MEETKSNQGIKVVHPKTGEVLTWANNSDSGYVPTEEEQELWEDLPESEK
jgi:hypothetical protein